MKRFAAIFTVLVLASLLSTQIRAQVNDQVSTQEGDNEAILTSLSKASSWIQAHQLDQLFGQAALVKVWPMPADPYFRLIALVRTDQGLEFMHVLLDDKGQVINKNLVSNENNEPLIVDKLVADASSVFLNGQTGLAVLAQSLEADSKAHLDLYWFDSNGAELKLRRVAKNLSLEAASVNIYGKNRERLFVSMQKQGDNSMDVFALSAYHDPVLKVTLDNAQNIQFVGHYDSLKAYLTLVYTESGGGQILRQAYPDFESETAEIRVADYLLTGKVASIYGTSQGLAINCLKDGALYAYVCAPERPMLEKVYYEALYKDNFGLIYRSDAPGLQGTDLYLPRAFEGRIVRRLLNDYLLLEKNGSLILYDIATSTEQVLAKTTNLFAIERSREWIERRYCFAVHLPGRVLYGEYSYPELKISNIANLSFEYIYRYAYEHLIRLDELIKGTKQLRVFASNNVFYVLDDSYLLIGALR